MSNGTPLVCPRCNLSNSLATIETLIGYAQIEDIYVGPEGPVIDFNGYTDMDWGSSETVGIRCKKCDWEGQLDDLQPLADEADERDAAHTRELRRRREEIGRRKPLAF
ncbi:MAG: hypothetical protein ABSB69_04565 [Solirubrobacteraceae bacterium]|jgi:hypothetical protein